MNTRQNLLTLLIAASMSFAGAAMAQETPPTSDQAAQENQQMQQQQTEPLGMQGSSAEDWSMLKGHGKGYVEKSDALPNSWLESNFASCDKNSDGKVTEAEYTKCLKAKP
jgi:hypothetical protein